MNSVDDLRKYRIGVLSGGDSSEREISLKSGQAVFKGLTGAGLDAVLLDVNKDTLIDVIEREAIDIAFIALHGRFGEDGKVQEMLADKNIPYTGSGPESSRLALDKLASKKRFAEQGLEVPRCDLIRRVEDLSGIEQVFPCVVKPRHEGSSIGLSIVTSKDKMHDAVRSAFLFDEDVIVEEYITGREITVGILRDEAFPVVEICTASGVYDYDAKYMSGDTKYIVPADLEKSVSSEARDTALKAHGALGCKGFSRVDLRLSDDGRIFVLEVNTIPGMTERSLLPMAAREAGLDFSGLCVNMLKVALSEQ